MTQDNAARTMPFLRENFNYYFVHLETIRRDWSSQYGPRIWDDTSSYASLNGNQHHPEKNYWKHVWNNFCENIGLVNGLTPRIYSREFSLDWGCHLIRKLIHSIIGHLCIPLKIHKLTRWTWRGLQRIPVLGRTFKTCENFTNFKASELQKH